MIINNIKRTYGKPVKKMRSMSLEIIKKLVDQLLCGDHFKRPGDNLTASLSHWRIVMKVVVKFFTMARFEEIIEVKVSQLTFTTGGDLVITFYKAKTNQFFETDSVTVAGRNSYYDPVKLVKLYI